MDYKSNSLTVFIIFIHTILYDKLSVQSTIVIMSNSILNICNYKPDVLKLRTSHDWAPARLSQWNTSMYHLVEIIILFSQQYFLTICDDVGNSFNSIFPLIGRPFIFKRHPRILFPTYPQSNSKRFFCVEMPDFFNPFAFVQFSSPQIGGDVEGLKTRK